MRDLPIRLRLTLWYSAVLAVSLIALASVAWLAMRASLYAAIDAGLQERAAGVTTLLRDEMPRWSASELEAEMAEHAGDALQIRDERGGWLHRAAQAIDASLALEARRPGDPASLTDLTVSGAPYRSIIASVAGGGHVYTFQIIEPLRDVQAALDRFGRTMLVVAPIMLLVASAGGYLMSRRALRPVDAITATAQAITAGNLSQRLEVVKTGDELERLAGTLNSMLERLEAAFRQNRQFTADASHELRTPVAFMRTAAEVLLRNPRTDAEWRQGVEDIHSELTRTSGLIEDLMTLARADAGADPRRFSRTDLRGPIETACRQWASIGAARQVRVEACVGAQPVWLDADPHLLERLFVILVHNAVKYTPDNGIVTARLTWGSGKAIAEVSDTGIGIGPEDLPHVFKRFYRSDKARSRDTGGSGLGLAIAQWIVELHHGTITVESEPGRGSTFRVTLPALRL